MTRLPSMSSGQGQALPGAPALRLDPHRLVALLRQQCLLYDQLRSLSDQQGKCIHGGQTEPLLVVLAQRQRVLGELNAVNDEMTPYRSRWGQVRQDMPPAMQQQVGELLRQVEDQLAHIIQQDERDRRQLQESRQQVGTELSRLNKASAAAAAYRPAPGPDSKNRFTSTQG